MAREIEGADLSTTIVVADVLSVLLVVVAGDACGDCEGGGAGIARERGGGGGGAGKVAIVNVAGHLTHAAELILERGLVTARSGEGHRRGSNTVCLARISLDPS